MGLSSRQAYRESLRDGRVTFWDGESIPDITEHPNFRVPLAVSERDYDYDDAKRRDILTYRTETGEEGSPPQRPSS